MNLDSASPPPDETPGWHPDPLGSAKQRYFDGETWTDRVHKLEPLGVYKPKKTAWWRPGWRKMTWVLILWSAFMFLWLILGTTGADNGGHCAHEAHAYLSQQTCTDARDTGTAIGAVLIFVLWFIGFIFFSLIWFMTRPKGRECPVCGEKVKRGRTVCKSCQYDFAAAAQHEPRPA